MATTQFTQEEQDARTLLLVNRSVAEFMKTRDRHILEQSAKNAEEIFQKNNDATSSKAQYLIETEIEQAHEWEDLTWKNQINKKTFDFTKQVNDLWRKTHRAVAENRLDRIGEFAKKGKEICHKRLKVLRLADKKGWHTALEYMSDDLADDEPDRKRMRKAEKAASSNKKNDRSPSSSTSTFRRNPGYSTAPNRGRSNYAYGGDQAWRGFGRGGDQDINCFICNRAGHVSRDCPRRTSRFRPGDSGDNRRY